MMEQQFPASLPPTQGWSVPPGSSITAGSAETVRAANKQSSQKPCTHKIHLHGRGGRGGPQSISCATLKILHSFPAPLMHRSAREFVLFFKTRGARVEPQPSAVSVATPTCSCSQAVSRFAEMRPCTCSPGLRWRFKGGAPLFS